MPISDQEKSETYLCLHEIDPCVHKDMLSFYIELKKAQIVSVAEESENLQRIDFISSRTSITRVCRSTYNVLC